MKKVYQVWLCTNWGYGDGYEFTRDLVLFEGDWNACKKFVNDYEEENEHILHLEGQELLVEVSGGW